MATIGKVKQLKKGVDFIGVTCVFYCHDGKGKFLLHQRSQKCKDEQGRWDCGGGGLEFGETFEEGAIREIEEEYGTSPTNLKFACATNVLRKNRENQPTHWVALLFTAQVDPKKVKIGDPEKMMQIGWFKPQNFPEPKHSMLMRHYKLLRTKKSSVFTYR